MSDVLGTYSFLPWLRLGIANHIAAADADPSVKLRASMPVELTLTGKPVEGATDLVAKISRDVELYGPGDVIGIDPRAIVKLEPRDWITNFEPNYMPYIEFYEEDFLWRYTPAAPDLAKNRLRPWLALVVMKEAEFRDAPVLSSRPLPAVEVTAQPDLVFPPADQLWAWAHVHINKDMIADPEVTATTAMDGPRARLEALLRDNPDQAYSRLLCPRRLEPDTGYHAFLVPTFESGRLAGLGVQAPLANAAFFATLSAWADYPDRPAPTLHPYYRRWYFKTGTVGDFEYLVRLLKPRPPDSRLGRRDMDTQAPGMDIAGIGISELKGVLRLGGALKVPDQALTGAQEIEAQDYENWDDPYPHAFQEDLARFINLADDYALKGDPDPVITAPLYGRWHALTERLLFDAYDEPAPQRRNWVHELNLDPRWRVPAAFGTEVIQDNQEEYMDAAWGQVGDIIEANRRIRLAQLARETSFIWYDRHLGPVGALSVERSLVLTAPVQRRILADGITVRHAIARSTMPRAVLSAPMRRALRPRDHVAVALGFDSPKGPKQLLDRINNGEVSAAPPRVTPDDLPTLDELADALEPGGLPKGWPEWLRTHPWVKWLVLLLVLLLALIVLGFSLAAALILALAGLGLFAWLARIERQAEVAHGVLPDGASPEAIDALPDFPDFVLRDPAAPAAPEPRPGSGPDSGEAAKFKLALKDVHLLLDASAGLGRPLVRAPIDIAGLAGATYKALDPGLTVPAFTRDGFSFPAHIAVLNGERFREAMAYPEFDIPMYKPLLDPSAERFLPNINKIPPNTITLLETNQRFIEAYMVGLNHEFARELLWREYPTDQRGSYFRQFWDPSEAIDREGLTKAQLREKLRDIPPLHTWSLFSRLGDHDHREAPGENEEEVVLVIRGELLKKYPTAVIYAHKAKWQMKDGKIDTSKERMFETDGPVESWLRTPLYTAKAEPDITFLGFDLTAKEVKGGSGKAGNTDPGWFFVIKERPGEPRFGLDINREGSLSVWNDLAWPDVTDDQDKGFLQIKASGPTLSLSPPPPDEQQEKSEQHDEDKALLWHPGTNAAELAYILYQVPVLVGVHGSEMLPD